MKKILSIVLLFASILTLTACESDEYDKNIYIADDHSYLMIHDTKYILVEGLPVDFSYHTNGNYDVRYKGGVPGSTMKIWDYTGAKRYPWVGLFDEYFYMQDVILPNGIMIKDVSFDVHYTYCLPEDLEGVLSLFEDFRWSKNKAGIVSPSSFSYELSTRISEDIISIIEKTQEDSVLIVTDRNTRLYQGVVYDEKMCIEIRNFLVYFLSENEVYIIPRGSWIVKEAEENGTNITLSEASDYLVSEEYREELIAAFREAYKDKGKETFWPE